ncbi:hypothetical protein HC891_18875 [Candidatus Gracilibacteria bacterium]|nr:hypothetical protein [Candidatus Gracilibacteria bacterium]
MSDKQATTPDPANKGTQHNTRKRLEKLGLPADKDALPPDSPQVDNAETTDGPDLVTQQPTGGVLKDKLQQPAEPDHLKDDDTPPTRKPA